MKKPSELPNGYESEIEFIPARELKFDPRYQRITDPRWIQRLMGGYSPRLIGTILVGRRPDGRLFVIDGQHRATALVSLFGPDFLVRCEVISSSGWAEEKALFLEINNVGRRKVSKASLVHMALLNYEPEWLDIETIVTSLNYTFLWTATRSGAIRDWTAISAFEALEELFKARLLENTLRFIDSSWRGLPDSVATGTLRGVGALFAALGDTPEFRAVVESGKLAEHFRSISPGEVAQLASNLPARRKAPDRFWRAMVESYNYKAADDGLLLKP